MFSAVDVRTAVKKAVKAAEEYVGPRPGLRVEEVAKIDESAWNITLSWLEEDTIQKLKQETNPLRTLKVLNEPPPFERVYRVFYVRGDSTVEMKRAV